jgi:hypothetical protein
VYGESEGSHPYARRRRKSLKRRVRHSLERWLPFLLLSAALLLSAGVVRVMEVDTSKRLGQASAPALARPELVEAALAKKKRSREGVPSRRAPQLRVSEMPARETDSLGAVLSASVLERESGASSEPRTRESDDLEQLDELAPDDSVSPGALAPVPEPGTLVLVATGLAWSSRGGRGATSTR